MEVIGDDPAELAAARMLEYYRELEMLVALLVVKHGVATEGGHRLYIDSDEAFRLRERLCTTQPVVIKTYDAGRDCYCIDVL